MTPKTLSTKTIIQIFQTIRKDHDWSEVENRLLYKLQDDYMGGADYLYNEELMQLIRELEAKKEALWRLREALWDNISDAPELY